MNSGKNLDKDTISTNKLYKIASFLITLSVTVAGGSALALSFEKHSRYFASSLISIAFAIALGTSVLFALSALYIFKGEAVKESNSTAAKIFSIVSAVGASISFIYYIYADAAANLAANSAPAGSAEAVYEGPETITIALIITGAIAAAYSIFKAFSNNKAVTLFAGYIRVIFFALIITLFYLDFSVELNSPIKLLIQFGACAAMLATLAELRVIVGRSIASLFVATKLLTMIFACLNLAALCIQIIPNIDKYGHAYLLFPALLFICGIESGFELLTCEMMPRPKEGEEFEESTEIGDSDAPSQNAECEERIQSEATEEEASETKEETATEANEEIASEAKDETINEE